MSILNAIPQHPQQKKPPLLTAVPQPSPWDELIGPFYTINDYAAWEGITRQSAHKRVRAGSVLGVHTSDNHILIPTFQFNSYGERLPYLAETLAALGPAAPDGWSQAIWLSTPAPIFGTPSPISAAQALRSGRHVRVLQAARADAARVTSA